jgi:hypothetical protein
MHTPGNSSDNLRKDSANTSGQSISLSKSQKLSRRTGFVRLENDVGPVDGTQQQASEVREKDSSTHPLKPQLPAPIQANDSPTQSNPNPTPMTTSDLSTSAQSTPSNAPMVSQRGNIRRRGMQMSCPYFVCLLGSSFRSMEFFFSFYSFFFFFLFLLEWNCYSLLEILKNLNAAVEQFEEMRERALEREESDRARVNAVKSFLPREAKWRWADRIDVSFHVAAKLTRDEVRQRVGNSSCLIIFDDSPGDEPFNPINLFLGT